MTTKRRVVELAMHISAAACIVFAFLLLDLGAQALEAPESQADTVFVSFLSLGLAFLAFVSELVALGLRRGRA